MIRRLKDNEISVEEIFAREAEQTDVTQAVAEIIASVRREGDAALLAYCARFDGGAPAALEVTEQEKTAALDAVAPAFLAILKEAAENIRQFHRRQIRTDFVMTEKDGVVLGQRIIPLDKVGIYVPGGTASYPSSVLMNAVPAKLAGVGEIVMVTPAKNGVLNSDVVAAAVIGGVDRIFKIGGAQAVAALAYGTQTVPRVDKIVGPGNAFVAEAKKQVFGRVSIDMIAGPSEILVLADGDSDGDVVAADLLSQAEHDPMASAILVTDSPALADWVARAIEEQLPLLPRADIARQSIDQNGKIILAASMERGVEISNLIAPEHLELCVDDPFRYLHLVRHAGSVFLGRYAPEALGDYFAGPNHTLPTGGTARFSSPLSVDDFIKKTAFTYYTKEALLREGEQVDCFARREGLHAHGRSVTLRMEREGAGK